MLYFIAYTWYLVTAYLTRGDSSGDNIDDSHEIKFKHLLYGGVWKHVITSSLTDDSGVVQAQQHILSLLQVPHKLPSLMGKELTFRCLTRLDLWLTNRDVSPIFLSEIRPDPSSGEHHLVSVALSCGTTYNFQVLSTSHEEAYIHYLTLTHDSETQQFFLFAHIFYPVDKQDYFQASLKCSEESACASPYESSLTVLSNLAHSKDLIPSAVQDCCLPLLSDSMLRPMSHYRIDAQTHRDTASFFTREIKVMSYNIWNFFTHPLHSHQHSRYPDRIHRLAQILKQAQPDIVGFQEVRLQYPLGGKLGPNQVDHLVAALPDYQFIFQPAQIQGLERGRSEEGVAIFSKYPIIHHEYLLLFRNQTNSADSHQRICLHAVISVPTVGRIHILTTHFSLSHEAREASVAQILDFIQPFHHEPVILLGDLNATPEEKAMRMLTDSDTSGLLDVWSLLHPSSDGFTFSCIDDQLSKRIDYIYMNRETRMTAKQMEVVADKTKANAASDHRAVMATFQFDDEEDKT